MDKPTVIQIAVCEDMPADAALLDRHLEDSGVLFERRSFESDKIEPFEAPICFSDGDTLNE